MADLTEQPNTRSKDRGIVDLTQWHGPITGHMEKGIRIITYSTGHSVTDKAHLNQIRRVFDEVESFTNIIFRLAKGNSDIHIYTFSKMPEENLYAYTDIYNPASTRYVVLKPEYFDKSIAHEIGHALGLSHPEQQRLIDMEMEASRQSTVSKTDTHGSSPAYNINGTVMSYNEGDIRNAYAHFGPYDIAVLQNFYGKPKNKNLHEWVNTGPGLPSTIYSEKPVTIEVEPESGIYRLTLPSTKAQGLVTITDTSRVAFDTHIANVIVKPETVTNKELIGNELQNWLEAGSGDDRLVSKGNRDMLVGGAGKDQFVLTNGSLNTFIGDWTLDDVIVIPEKTYYLNFKHNPGFSGTLITALDVNGQIISSVNLPGTDTARVLQHLKTGGGWQKDIPSSNASTGLESAIAILRSLDIENADAPNNNQGDGVISRDELARISNHSADDSPLTPQQLAENRKRHDALLRACDLNNSGETSFNEMQQVFAQARNAGIIFDEYEAQQTLLTGTLPTAQGIPVVHREKNQKNPTTLN